VQVGAGHSRQALIFEIEIDKPRSIDALNQQSAHLLKEEIGLAGSPHSDHGKGFVGYFWKACLSRDQSRKIQGHGIRKTLLHDRFHLICPFLEQQNFNICPFQ